MRILSKTSVYGIRAALFVAGMEGEVNKVSVRQISNELGISFHFLAKIVHTLTQHNIMTSCRGRNGGVKLARPASDITFMDMVVALEHEHCFSHCILELSGCSKETPCPFYKQWHDIVDRINTMLESTNLHDVGRSTVANGLLFSSGGSS